MVFDLTHQKISTVMNEEVQMAAEYVMIAFAWFHNI
jgi:hypothetical protein